MEGREIKIELRSILSSDLGGGDHPGHSWLAVLSLTVEDLVRLAAACDLSVQTGLKYARYPSPRTRRQSGPTVYLGV